MTRKALALPSIAISQTHSVRSPRRPAASAVSTCPTALVDPNSTRKKSSMRASTWVARASEMLVPVRGRALPLCSRKCAHASVLARVCSRRSAFASLLAQVCSCEFDSVSYASAGVLVPVCLCRCARASLLVQLWSCQCACASLLVVQMGVLVRVGRLFFRKNPAFAMLS